MNREWKQYLQPLGAVLSSDGETIEHFGQPELEHTALISGNVMMPITGRTCIHASGDDAKSFLQGQLTNDIGLLTQQQSQLSGYCNPKGRLLALFRISQHETGYRLHLPEPLLDKTLKRLKMFVLMAKVKLEASPPEVVRIGVVGAQAFEKLDAYFTALPEDENGVIEADGVTLLRHPGKHPRFELIAEVGAMQKLWEKLLSEFTPVGSGAWTLLDIDAGQPQVVSETVEMFIPQMLNLHVINGVSFKKGCYPGQEVVARLHYRGKLKRHMHIAQFSAEQRPLPGAPLYPVDAGKEAQSVGNIVLAQPATEGLFHALCVIANEHAVDNSLSLQQGEKASFKLHDLPYNFPAVSE